MPRYEITATIEVRAEFVGDNAKHAQQLFDRMSIEDIAKQWGDLEVHDVNLIPEPGKSWSSALGPLG